MLLFCIVDFLRYIVSFDMHCLIGSTIYCFHNAIINLTLGPPSVNLGIPTQYLNLIA